MRRSRENGMCFVLYNGDQGGEGSAYEKGDRRCAGWRASAIRARIPGLFTYLPKLER